MEYLFHIVIIAGIYASLAVSLSLSAGQAGLLSLAPAAIFGVGAYTTALLASNVDIPLAGGLPCAMAIAAVASIPLAVAASRLRGDHFIMATLGYQVFLASVFENWVDVTKGPLGLASIPRRIFDSWYISSNSEFACLALVLSVLSVFVAMRLSNGAFGRVLHCIRDDESIALALGKDIRRFKFQILMVSGAIAGAAGSLYATYTTFVDPSAFTINESIVVATMAIVGGIRTLWGPVLGAAALVLIPELLRFSGIPHTVAAPLHQAIFGVALIWIVMNLPQGLLGSAKGKALSQNRKTK